MTQCINQVGIVLLKTIGCLLKRLFHSLLLIEEELLDVVLVREDVVDPVITFVPDHLCIFPLAWHNDALQHKRLLDYPNSANATA